MMMYTNEGNSIRELMYLMRDAVERDTLEVALFLSRQIHDKIQMMIIKKTSIDCVLDCNLITEGNNGTKLDS